MESSGFTENKSLGGRYLMYGDIYFWVGCSNSRAHKTWSRSFFLKKFRQELRIDHNPYYLSGLSRAHFFSIAFFEIAHVLYKICIPNTPVQGIFFSVFD